MEKIEHEVARALVEVRKAYRLLWLFHRRVFDIIETIKEQFGAEYYYSNIDNKPGQAGSDLLNRWVWDMLPMQRMSLLFLNNVDKAKGHDYPQKGDILLDLTITVDSGRDEKNYRGIDVDPTIFKPVEDCKTYLAVYVFVNTENIKKRTNWYYDIWHTTEYPSPGICQDHESIPNIKTYGEKFDLHLLYSKDAIISQIDGFRDRVRDKMAFDLSSRKFLR